MTSETTQPKPNRRVTVTRSAEQGWEVMEERDNRVVRRLHLSDWHRVERVLGLHSQDRLIESNTDDTVTD